MAYVIKRKVSRCGIVSIAPFKGHEVLIISNDPPVGNLKVSERPEEIKLVITE